MNGLLPLVYGAGMLSAINPCGLAMLPAFLALYTNHKDTGLAGRLGRGLIVGVLITAGFAAIYTTAGLLLALGLRTILAAVPWLGVIVGAGVVTAGILLLAGRHLGLRLGANRYLRDGNGLGAAIGFGIAYAIASLACNLAVLLSVITQALTTTGPAQIAAVFAAYTAGTATLLIPLTLAAALASTALAKALRRASRHTDRVASALLALSGLYLIAYWTPALATGRPNTTLDQLANQTAAYLVSLITEHQTLAILAAALATALAAAAALRKRHRAPTPTRHENR